MNSSSNVEQIPYRDAIRAGCSSARTLKINPRGSAVAVGTISKKKISLDANPNRLIATPNRQADTVNAEIGYADFRSLTSKIRGSPEKRNSFTCYFFPFNSCNNHVCINQLEFTLSFIHSFVCSLIDLFMEIIPKHKIFYNHVSRVNFQQSVHTFDI